MKKLPILLFILLFSIIGYKGICQNGNASLSNNVFQSSLIAPKTITKIGENHYFIDFGKDAFGTLVLTAKRQLKDTIIIHLGEKTLDTHTIDREPGATIRYQKIKLKDIPFDKEYTVKLQPDNRNTGPNAIALPDSFGVIMPFRYCEIENLTIPISDIIIKQKVYNYHFNDEASDFISSDTVLNKIWELCKHTIKATSFAGIYIDGDRERIPYEADAFINQMSHFSVDTNYSMAQRTNEYFINHPTWPTEWILHTVLLFYHDYMYTGDIQSIKNNYEALKFKTLLDLERQDGLISSKSDKITDEFMKNLGFKDVKQRMRDIVDWPPSQNETTWKLASNNGERDGYEMLDINTVVNSFHYINLKLMSEIAGYLSKKEDSINFNNRSVLVRNTINQKLFNKNTGLYVDGENSKHSSLHANMFPLAFGIVPDEYIPKIDSFIKTKGMACSVYGTQYLLEGLYKQNEADYAYELLTSKSDRSWWNMLKVGSTMTLEAWDVKYKPNLDWNHAWGTAPLNIIARYMWGITPVSPGFSKVQIKPQLSRLSFSKIKIPTIKGTIFAEYKTINSKHKLYIIEIPQGMKCDFVLLKDKDSKIFLNNKKIKPIEGTIPLNPGTNKIEIIQ